MTLLDLVERERKGIARHLTTGGVALIATAVVAVLLAATLLLGDSRWLSLPRLTPFIGWTLAVVAAVAGGRWLHTRLGEETSVTRIARAVEEEGRLRDGSVRAALEVASHGALGRLNAEQVAGRLSPRAASGLAPALRKSVGQRALAGLGLAVAGILALVSAASAAPDGWRALLHPVMAWNGTLLGGVTLTQAPRSVLRGEQVQLTVRAPGRRAVTVAQRVTGSSWRERVVTLAGDSAVVSLGPLDADLAIYATDGRSTSDTMAVRVVDRPFIGDVTVRATFPDYLGRRPEHLPLGELVRIPRGTALAIEGHSSTELAAVRLADGTTDVPLAVSARDFRGEFRPVTGGTFRWTATGRSGAIEDLPPALQLEVQPDSAPRVEILSPGRDTVVSARDTIGVSMLATDDHGLSAAALRVTISNASGEVRSTSVRSLGTAQGEQFQGQVALAMGVLAPGDRMQVVATATDASPWRQIGQSAALVLRLPTLSEQRDAIRSAADAAVAEAQATANAQKQLNQRTADAARAQQRAQQQGKDAMSYEASEQAKQFAKEQRQLADRMQQMQESARKLEQSLRQTGALDSALQERLREAQKLLRDALTPELQEKLRKLEQASQNMSGDESKRALQDLSEQQRRLREQLDKSVEMLKRAALEGQMSTLKDEARELAKNQRSLVDSLRMADQREEKAAAERMAKELADRAKNLQEDVKQLQERLKKEKAEAGADRVKDANEKIDESLEKLQQAMQQQQQQGQRQDGQQQSGQQQAGQKQDGQKQDGQKQDGQSGQSGQKQDGAKQQGQEQKGGEKQQQGQSGQQGQTAKDGQQQSQNESGPGQQGGQKGESQANQSAAEQAAKAMEDAANELQKAREQQVGEWKKELTGELDQSIQEMLQLGREQDKLEQQARSGASPSELRAQQSALQQGVEKTMQRLQQAATKSNLLSQRSLRMMNDARRKVEDATAQSQRAQNGPQMASAMREAGESLNQAGASLVRDRERTQNSDSSTGFAEMLEQLQEMARQQQALNSAAQDLMPKPGSKLDGEGQNDARALAQQQREVAAKLEEQGNADESGRADEMAREARQIAQQLESANLDASVLERQQRLFRKMLDAGRLLEEDQREDTGKREATSWTGTDVFTPPSGSASGKGASKFTPPTWNELRGLTPEERRLVLEYFKRINGKP